MSVTAVLAVSPCPTGYDLTVISGQCVCKHGQTTTSPNPSCTYTVSGENCNATCPTGQNQRRRRQIQELLFNEDGSITNCRKGQVSCPITSARNSRHECVDIKSDLDNCGGCAATGEGVICGRERGVRSASCDRGICHIHSCRAGYQLDKRTQKCVFKH
ncbi:hypothetical protein AX15_004209 [Amanita polypyramis BW_CC]|nr:hypothetical protein AX15_004209 [Amanita polypyramis BW_CC]